MGKEAEGGREGASKRAGGSGLGGWPPVQMISPDSCVCCASGRMGKREWGVTVCREEDGEGEV